MESKESFQFTQKSTIGLYSEPLEYSSQLTHVFPQIFLNDTLLSMLMPPN